MSGLERTAQFIEEPSWCDCAQVINLLSSSLFQSPLQWSYGTNPTLRKPHIVTSFVAGDSWVKGKGGVRFSGWLIRNFNVSTKKLHLQPQPSTVLQQYRQRQFMSDSSTESTAKMAEPAGRNNTYDTWEKDRLISHIRKLESQLQQQPNASAPSSTSLPPAPTSAGDVQPPPAKKRKKGTERVDPSRYSTRFIALKLAYLGKNYGGFEYQPSSNIPTIESTLWAALTRACLVFPRGGGSGEDAPVDFDSCEYSKCGRTDRGVSAFGQVIALRVRSNRPLPKQQREPPEAPQGEGRPEGQQDVSMTDASESKPEEGAQSQTQAAVEEPPWDDSKELDYCKILNRLLPKDIRILAWCPSPPPGFSARFSCIERQYRYFFTQPAFNPIPAALLPTATATATADSKKTTPPAGWLDIDVMREAARRFIGPHDFRNFCKVDGSKQLTSFERVMFDADIVEVPGASSALPYLSEAGVSVAPGEPLPKVYSFNVRGSSFLWHQIRHMVAVLFLVGQGLEPPSIVSELLDVERNPRKPSYQMAHEVPLVLWDCLFREGDKGDKGDKGDSEGGGLRWVYEAEENRHAWGGVLDALWEEWRERKMDELLANRLLDHVMRLGSTAGKEEEGNQPRVKNSMLHKVFAGGDNARRAGTFMPLLERSKAPSPEEINDRWAQRKGFKSAEAMRNAGDWRNIIKEEKNSRRAASQLGNGEE
ncbi:pseudouridine synthase [Sodiomyces alkalinus F11]|uniref:Pseudouridine synthase n=1 Tax=Sodiomyces alkalinus (strain CBS 110278 / VKM F-3762 / F11) TaxID=1314773 RepID=A0A3N2Q9T6_SODAK|nr:pseudouridine synthase [Sodiomyces alkalinus F11]ROT43519.1 pseudouridine synthase [Sodiomyces alkalinus F11]